MKLNLKSDLWKSYFESGYSTQINEPTYIASSADDSLGAGNLLLFPESEVLEIGEDGDELYIIADTTEGIQRFNVTDIQLFKP